MKKTLLLLGFICFSFFVANGQGRKLFTGSYQQTLFIDLISDLESTYDLKFYFNPELDSTKVNIVFQDIELSELLNLLTSECNVNFFVKNNNIIIETGEFNINPQLNNELFDKYQDEKTVSASSKSILDNIREKAKVDKEYILENQVVEIGNASQRFDGETAIISGYVRRTLGRGFSL